MKKRRFGLLAMVFLVTLGVSTRGEEGAEGEDQKLSMVTSAGIPYMVGLAMENLSNRFAHGVKVDARSVGNEREVLELLTAGEADLGLVTMMEIAKSFKTTRERERTGLRLVMGGHAAMVAHVFVRQDVPINGISDFKGRRVGLPEPGSDGESLARTVLATHGLSYKHIKPIFMRVQEQVKAFEIGFVDAAILVVPVPSPVVASPAPRKIASLGSAKLLSLEDKYVNELVSRHPGYSRHRIDPHTYPGQDEGIRSVARKNAVIARKGVETESVYAFAKAILEHPSEFAKLCPLAMAYTPKNVLPGTALLPLHPGAERYYKERGIL